MAFDVDELTAQLDEVHRYALAVTRDADAAADVVQETAARALERADQYRGDAPLGHWLIRIAHHLVVDRARAGARELVVEEVEDDWRDDSFSVDAEAVVERAATRAELEDALARLPHAHRTAVLLHDVEGLRVLDVAALEGIFLPAAKQRLRRGRMALVRALAEGHERRAATKGLNMRCWDARQHISEYLDGALDRDVAVLVEDHLERCPTCPPLYAALVGVHAHLGRLRDSDAVVPPQVAERIRVTLESGPRPEASRP